MDAYNCAMELEESCHVAWLLRDTSEARCIPDV